MAKNYIQDGKVLLYTNLTGAAIASGAPVDVGARVGVAAVDIPDQESGSVYMEGVFSLPKVAGAIAQGADVYLSNAKITTTAGAQPAGYAFEAAAAGDAEAAVKLNA
jgi:predicted RecA/RadA family phage recombinase